MQKLVRSHQDTHTSKKASEPDIEFFHEMERRFARHKLEELANGSE